MASQRDEEHDTDEEENSDDQGSKEGPSIAAEGDGQTVGPPGSPSVESEPSEEPTEEQENGPESDSDSEEEEKGEFYSSAEEDAESEQDPRIKVLSVLELEALFLHSAPDLSSTSKIIC